MTSTESAEFYFEGVDRTDSSSSLFHIQVHGPADLEDLDRVFNGLTVWSSVQEVTWLGPLCPHRGDTQSAVFRAQTQQV